MENSHFEKDAARPRPLDPMSAEEIAAAVRILRTQGPASDHLRFVSVNLHEPTKTELESIGAGNTVDRRAFIIVIDLVARRVLEALVSLLDETLLSCEDRRDVQPGIIVEEFLLGDTAVKADLRCPAR